MGGDGMGALVMAILVACVLMVELPALLGAWLAQKGLRLGLRAI